MCSGLFLEKIFFVGLFKLSGKLPSPDQNDTYVPPSFSSSCKLSKILFQFVEKKLQFKTISGIMCCIKQSVYDCFKDINFWSAARLAEIYNGGTGVSASRRPGLWAGLHQQPPPHVLYRTSLKGFMFSQASNFTTKLNALFWIGKGLLWVTLANWLDRFCPSILTVGSWVDSLGRSTETRQVFSESPWPGKANSILTTTSWVGRSTETWNWVTLEKLCGQWLSEWVI